MEEAVKLRIDEMYNSLMEKPRIIQGIFNDFFGEEFIDMQGYPSLERYTEKFSDDWQDYILHEGATEVLHFGLFTSMFILVRFPKVRITNENDKYIDIWELFVKVPIHSSGQAGIEFTLARSKYNLLQLNNSYMHSHISSIPLDSLETFRSPCLGSGPIRGTMAALSLEEFDELRWQLFCLELSKYVVTESLVGGPHKRLEALTGSSYEKIFNVYSMEIYDTTQFNSILDRIRFKDFIKWVIAKKTLRFNYAGSYSIAMSYLQWNIFISNEFIEWYNQTYHEGEDFPNFNELCSEKVLLRGIIKEGCLYTKNQGNTLSDYTQYVNNKVCVFKGETMRLSIIEEDEELEDNLVTLLNRTLTEMILKHILRIVNYEYSNRTENQTNRDGEKVYFI